MSDSTFTTHAEPRRLWMCLNCRTLHPRDSAWCSDECEEKARLAYYRTTLPMILFGPRTFVCIPSGTMLRPDFTPAEPAQLEMEGREPA